MPAMFQARHYVKIAEVLKAARPPFIGSDGGPWLATVLDFADEFQADNPKFDRDRFMAACHPAPIPMKD